MPLFSIGGEVSMAKLHWNLSKNYGEVFFLCVPAVKTLSFSVFVIRMEQAVMFMQTPALCRGLQLGAKRWSSTKEESPPPQTQAAWSCSALEHGVVWSVKPPCFSSVSSQRAGEEEEEEEGHLPRYHHESVRHSDLHAIEI